MTERELIDWLDEHPADPATCTRLGAILVDRITGWSGEEAAILAAHRRGMSEQESRAAQDRLWERVRRTDPRSAPQGGQRMLVGLLGHREDPLDGYLAEYLVAWCVDAGGPREDVLADFRACLQR